MNHLLLLAPLLIAQGLAQEPVLDPPEAYDISLVLGETPEDALALLNETSLYLSVQVEEIVDGEFIVRRPHISGYLDTSIVGPQWGLLTGFSETKLSLGEFEGRNLRITILTPGGAPGPATTEAERDLQFDLLVRTLIDQGLMPAVSIIAGYIDGWDDPTAPEDVLRKRAAIQAIASAILTHHQNLVFDIAAALQGGDSLTVGDLILNFLLREISGGGPVVSVLPEVVVNRLVSGLQKYALAGIVPGGKVILAAIKITGIGSSFATIVKSFDDGLYTPGKLVFHVYHEPVLATVSPTYFEPVAGEPMTFELRGFGFDLEPTRPVRATILAPDGAPVATTVIPRTQLHGRRLSATFSAEQINSFEGWGRLQLEVGDRVLLAPEALRSLGKLDLAGVYPNRGRAGQVVRLEGRDLSPHFGDVYFGRGEFERVKARTILLTRDHYLVEVPPLPKGDTSVWIEREKRTVTRRSPKRAFHVLAGTDEEFRKDLARDRLPEETTEVSGTLGAGADTWEHEFQAPAGMQVLTRLARLDSSEAQVERGPIDSFTLEWRDQNGEFQWVDGTPLGTPPGKVRAWDLASHTSAGQDLLSIYRLRLVKSVGPATNFVIEIEQRRVDDLGTGTDSGGKINSLPWLTRYRAPLTGHLFSGRGGPGVDSSDGYRLPEGEVGQTIEVLIEQIEGLAPFAAPAGIGQVKLFEPTIDSKSGDRGYRIVAEVFDLPAGSGPTRIQHIVRNRGAHVLALDQAAGNVRYRMRVNLDFAQPWHDAVQSDFNGRSDEGWALTNREGGASEVPILLPSSGPSGKNAWLHAPARSDEDRPSLEIMLAVDTTNSMKPHIDAVREAAAIIVAGLEGNALSLRIGLLSYRDVDSDPQPFRRIPLNDRATATLGVLGEWGLGSGGQDTPEDVLLGIRHALNVDWTVDKSTDVVRAVIVIGDAPAKLNADLRDRKGNTLASVIHEAKSKGVILLPIVVGDSTTWAAQAQRLADGTGGIRSNLDSSMRLPELVIQIAQSAAQRQQLRWWNAPAKFHGARGTAVGRILSFKVAASGSGAWIDAPDVILESKDTTLEWRGFLRPGPVNAQHTRWTDVRIALDPSAGWIDAVTGEPATTAAIGLTLNTLTGLRIRADHCLDGECWIDDIVLGADGAGTDIAPSLALRAELNALERASQSVIEATEFAGDLPAFRARAREVMTGHVAEPHLSDYVEATVLRVQGALADIDRAVLRDAIQAKFRDRVKRWTHGATAPFVAADKKAMEKELAASVEMREEIIKLVNIQSVTWNSIDRARRETTAAGRRIQNDAVRDFTQHYNERLDRVLALSRRLH